MPGQGTVVVCNTCNRDKANKTITEWVASLDAKGDQRAGIVRAFVEKNPNVRISPICDPVG